MKNNSDMRMPPAFGWSLRILAGFVTLAGFVIVGYTHVQAHYDEFAAQKIAVPALFLFVIAAVTCNLLARILYLRKIIASESGKLSNSDFLHTMFVCNLLALTINPALGAALRVTLLARSTGISVARMVTATLTFMTTLTAMSGIVCLTFLAKETVTPVAALVAAALSILIFSRLRNTVQPGSDQSRLGLVIQFLRPALAFSLLCILSQTIAVVSAGRVLGQDISWTSGILLAASLQVGGLISLTPGSAGFQEVIALYLVSHFDLHGPDVLSILLVIRAASIATAVLTGMPGIALFWRRFKVPSQSSAEGVRTLP